VGRQPLRAIQEKSIQRVVDKVHALTNRSGTWYAQNSSIRTGARWRSAAMEIAAAGRAVLAIGAAIKERVLNKLGKRRPHGSESRLTKHLSRRKMGTVGCLRTD
jgi:hypothetical protein